MALKFIKNIDKPLTAYCNGKKYVGLDKGFSILEYVPKYRNYNCRVFFNENCQPLCFYFISITEQGGMSALQAGTAVAEKFADGAEQIVDKVSGAIISILAKGVEYATVAVSTGLIYELSKNTYHLTAIAKDSVVYIAKTPIDRVLATWAVRSDLSIYTFYSENAYQVAKDAGDGRIPVYDSAHTHKNGVQQKGIFFDHWHKYNHAGKSHCMFGMPYIYL